MPEGIAREDRAGNGRMNHRDKDELYQHRHRLTKGFFARVFHSGSGRWQGSLNARAVPNRL